MLMLPSMQLLFEWRMHANDFNATSDAFSHQCLISFKYNIKYVYYLYTSETAGAVAAGDGNALLS